MPKDVTVLIHVRTFTSEEGKQSVTLRLYQIRSMYPADDRSSRPSPLNTREGNANSAGIADAYVR